MARSLIGGLIGNGFSAHDITVADPVPAATQSAAADFDVNVAKDNLQAVTDSDAIVMAVKPQQMKPVLSDMQEALDSQILISIAAGVLLKDIAAWSNSPALSIVRCMPNTPALLQCGATGLYAPETVAAEQRQIAEQILQSVGTTVWVQKEQDLDAVTAVSGSGPAYFFHLIEAMSEAGVSLGLSHEVAQELAIQTALGAARMAAKGDTPPSQLRKNVTSPGGTTEAAIKSFTNNNFKQVVGKAMQAAQQRALQLGVELGDS